MKLRSLFLALAGALLLTAALVPRANADLIVYFNFEHGTLGTPNWGMDSANLGAPDFNPGGGVQNSTLSLVTTADFSSAGGLLLNRTALDSDPAAPVPPSFNGQALLLNDTKGTTAELCFTVNTTFLTDLSLTFATDNNGNGYDTVQLSASINGGASFNIGSPQDLTTGVTLMTFNIGNGGGNFLGNGTLQNTEFCLTFTGGASNGQDRQTVIDNIQLNGAIIPEPATVAGGLLGLCGLCWHQRRRLVRFLRLRPA